MRHNHSRMNADAKGSDPADRAAADVARMHDDELIEVVASYPLSDAPAADQYFEGAVKELAARIDRRREVVACR